MDSERLEGGDARGCGADEDSDSAQLEEGLGGGDDAQGAPLAEPLDRESMEWVDEVIPRVDEASARSGRVEDLRRDYPAFRDGSPGPKLKGGDKASRGESPLGLLRPLWDDVVVSGLLGVASALRKRRQPKRAQAGWAAVDFWSLLGLTLRLGVA